MIDYVKQGVNEKLDEIMDSVAEVYKAIHEVESALDDVERSVSDARLLLDELEEEEG